MNRPRLPRSDAATRRTITSGRRGRWWLQITPAMALFLLLSGIYLLTSGGHTYSYDEETMFALTSNLVERGSIVIQSCPDCPVIRSDPSPPAPETYSRYGPVQSLLAIPFYFAGRALAGDGDSARWFTTRFFVVLLNSFVTAAGAALLYRLIRALGYRHAIALSIALLYGLGSQVWPRAKTFFSDPLSTALLLAALYCWWRLYTLHPDKIGQATWWTAGIGAACGVAVGTKYAAGILLPIFGVAGAIALWRLRQRAAIPWSRLLVSLLAALLLSALPFAMLGLYNAIRFGSPLITGYGGSEVGKVQQGDFLAGLSGELWSPGKGLLVFSPLIVPALCAWPLFLRRHRALALLTGALAIAQVLFYARVPQWDAGTSWGPRYLDGVVPLLMLALAPGLAWLLQQRIAARLIIGLPGVLVIMFAVLIQSLGVLVNFDTGYNRVTAGQRYWTVSNAPPLIHAAILRERLMAWRETRFTQQDGILPTAGIRLTNEQEAIWPRFLPRQTIFWLHVSGDEAVTGTLIYDDARANQQPSSQFTIWVNGRLVETSPVAPAPAAGQTAYSITFTIRQAGNPQADFPLMITNEQFASQGPARILDLEVRRGAVVLPTRRPPLILPFPDNYPERFAWFLTDRNAHLVDLWPWYVATVGLSPGFGQGLVIGTTFAAILLVLLGLAGLRQPHPAR